MSEEKNTLKIIDDTITAVEDVSEKFNQITQVLKKSQEELRKLEDDKVRLKHEMEDLERSKQGLEIATKKLAEAKDQLEKDKADRDLKIGAMTEEQQKLLDEYAKLRVELQKFEKAAAEAEDEEFNFERIKALLSIYTVLIEKIFQGQPHYRILLVLHGDKELMTRDEIKNTTGIGGAFVLRALQELDKAGLVEFNIDNNTAKLIKRLFPKAALDEK